ncbi:MAG: hypothetical protein QM237_05245 [Bacteroidota bacterium]|jgi:hypothetical protein|nr:hypothetical protein [Bacteroidota bacterium]HHU95772.1 hypothetical protein [Petrimonas sp.]
MKKRISLPWILITIMLALLIWQGCDPDGIEKNIGNSDTGYEGFQSDVELFYEFAYLKEAMMLEFLNYTSDGFTKGPLEGTLSIEECRRLVSYVADISEKAEQYEAAAQQLEQSGVLMSPTRTRGLFGSITNFFGKVSGIQKRNRQRYMVVYTNVDKKTRTKMYESAKECWDTYGWGNKPYSEKEFYDRMLDGSYDEHGNRLMGDLLASDNEDVIVTLQEKGLTLQDLTKDYGEIAASGAQIALDAFSTVVPGAEIGMEIVTVTDNVDRLANAKDFNEKAKAKEDMKNYLKGKFFGETTVEVSDFVCEQLAEHIERVSQEATQEFDKKEQGKIVVKDKNEEQPAKIVISQKKESAPSDDGPSIYVTGKKWVKEGIDQALAVGKWLVTAINEQGRRETVEIDVKPGKVTVTEVNTAEPEEDEDDDQEGGKTYYLLGNIHFFTVPDAATAKTVDLNVYHDSWHINFRGSRGLWLDEFSSCTEPTDFFALKQNPSDKKQFSGKGNVTFTKTVSALGKTYISDINEVTEMELTVDKAEKPTKITKLTLNHTSHQEGHYANESDVYVFNEKSAVAFENVPISLLTKYTEKVNTPAKWMKSATYVYNTKGGAIYIKGSDLSPYLVSATGTKNNMSSKKLFAKNTIIMFYYVEKK